MNKIHKAQSSPLNQERKLRNKTEKKTRPNSNFLFNILMPATQSIYYRKVTVSYSRVQNALDVRTFFPLSPSVRKKASVVRKFGQNPHVICVMRLYELARPIKKRPKIPFMGECFVIILNGPFSYPPHRFNTPGGRFQSNKTKQILRANRVRAHKRKRKNRCKNISERFKTALN